MDVAYLRNSTEYTLELVLPWSRCATTNSRRSVPALRQFWKDGDAHASGELHRSPITGAGGRGDSRDTVRRNSFAELTRDPQGKWRRRDAPKCLRSAALEPSRSRRRCVTRAIGDDYLTSASRNDLHVTISHSPCTGLRRRLRHRPSGRLASWRYIRGSCGADSAAAPPFRHSHSRSRRGAHSFQTLNFMSHRVARTFPGQPHYHLSPTNVSLCPFSRPIT